ncbi:MAG: peptidyl-prolyl cis-trans isomerase [Deltaproteobacteria bacterium]|nr:peptidyl-prolyl cis-trans isomerase [Deltaproteobacteria bacterium]
MSRRAERRAPRERRARRGLPTWLAPPHFAAVGVVAWAVARVAAPAELPVVVVQVASDAAPAAVERATEEALLLEAALDAGLDRRDPFVRERLLADARATRGGEGAAPADDAALVAEARAAGFVRRDPLIRQRLAERVRAMAPAPEDPGDEALAAFVAAHRADFEAPARVTLTQVFLASARGAGVEAEAEALVARLRAEEPAPAALRGLGDPLLALPLRADQTVAELDRRLGEGFGARVAALPVGRWSGPVRSSFGLHAVRVEARVEAAVPPLGAIRPAVLAAYRAREVEPARRARLEALRARYDVRVERLP